MKKWFGLALGAVIAMGAGLAVAEESAPLKAVCELKPTKGNKVSGVVKFIQRKGSVTVRAHVTGLTLGWHGFHIHESGDCSAPDASSAKGHFNPGKHDHGSPTGKTRHAGDLGNLKANEKGVAYYDRDDATITLSGKDNVIGRSIIVHEKVDDYKTQPTGNAGPRAACGKIEIAKPKAEKKTEKK